MRARILLQLTTVIPYAVFSIWAAAQTSVTTYQGQLTDDGSPASGIYDLTFTLHDAATNGTALGVLTNTAIEVSGGVFTVTLDFGLNVFDGADRWVALAVATNGSGTFTSLNPRQPITSAPYAIKAANAMTVAMGTISDPAFIGTTTSSPLELQVNNEVGLRLEYPTAGSVPNLVGGYSGNSVGNGTEGAVIAGGGTSGLVNAIGADSDYSTIAGGGDNRIADNSAVATISGGSFNYIGTNCAASTISGGDRHSIADNSELATISGGYTNSIGEDSNFATIGGGDANSIASNSYAATIAGGNFNRIGANAENSTIGGGVDNDIALNSGKATISGGELNNIGVDSDSSSIGGGTRNTIADTSQYATISGGFTNSIGANSPGAIISGGALNYIGTNSGTSTIGGGVDNKIANNSEHAIITGGEDNIIGTNAWYAVIPGGHLNGVGAGASYAFAAGRQAKANHAGAFVWGDSFEGDVASSTANQFTLRASGGTRIFSNTALTTGVSLAAGGGSWTIISDRNAKENFREVHAERILEKVTALPLTTWNYKSQCASIRHIGPVAQDFQAAFGVGESDTGITVVDANGVALAAIQGLNQKLERENARLRRQLEDLRALVEILAKEEGQP